MTYLKRLLTLRSAVAEWRPHSGPTREKHPKFLLPTEEAVVPMCLHMAGQHSEHIVFGANKYACWLRCTLCEQTSRRALYRYTICMKCPGRRHDDDEPLWATAHTMCVSKVELSPSPPLWRGREDTHTSFAYAIKELHQRRRFVDIDEDEYTEQYQEVQEVDPSRTQGPSPIKLSEGLEQCLSWHQRAWALLRHVDLRVLLYNKTIFFSKEHCQNRENTGQIVAEINRLKNWQH